MSIAASESVPEQISPGEGTGVRALHVVEDPPLLTTDEILDYLRVHTAEVMDAIRSEPEVAARIRNLGQYATNVMHSTPRSD